MDFKVSHFSKPIMHHIFSEILYTSAPLFQIVHFWCKKTRSYETNPPKSGRITKQTHALAILFHFKARIRTQLLLHFRLPGKFYILMIHGKSYKLPKLFSFPADIKAKQLLVCSNFTDVK